MIRTTKGGRRLQYELYVLQQPERARACGSGAKCMFDRFFSSYSILLRSNTILYDTNNSNFYAI